MTTVATEPIRLAMSRWTDFPKMLAERGLTYGAEIGVEQGLYSKALLKGVPGLHLLCVDAWQAYRGYRDHVSQEKLDGFYAYTQTRLKPYRASIIRKFSVDAAKDIPDGSLDFVYIDGNHGYQHVLADLASWEPKVRSGGVVAGHDYGRSSVGQVKEAVDQWVAEHGITEWYLLVGDKSPSWMWVKV